MALTFGSAQENGPNDLAIVLFAWSPLKKKIRLLFTEQTAMPAEDEASGSYLGHDDLEKLSHDLTESILSQFSQGK